MAKKLTRIQRLMEERPEMFDFGDVPPARKIIPEQEARYDAMRPQWAKDLAKANGYK
jgi:hypothetical protein